MLLMNELIYYKKVYILFIILTEENIVIALKEAPEITEIISISSIKHPFHLFPMLNKD